MAREVGEAPTSSRPVLDAIAIESRFIHQYISRPRVLFASTFIWLTVLGGRFLAPFLENEAGLSSSEIGICLSLQQLAITFASGLAGSLADRRERRANNNNNSITTTTTTTRGTRGRKRNYGRVQIILCGVLLATCAFVLHGLQHLCPEWKVFQSLEWHASLQLVQGLGLSMVFPVMDGLTIAFLEHRPLDGATDRRDYGRERLHGPLWWALANLVLSPLLDSIGFSVCYPLAIAGVVVVGISGWTFLSYQESYQEHCNINHRPISTTELETMGEPKCSAQTRGALPQMSGTETSIITNQLSIEDPSSPNHSLLGLLQLLVVSSGGGGVFLFAVICISSGQAVVDNLVFLFFEALGSKWLIMGITVVIKIVFEVPIFYYGPYLLRRYGHSTVLLLGCLCYLARAIAYPFVPKGHMLYPILLEPLHGITYGSVQVAMVDFVAQAMPDGYEASGQGLVYLFKDGGSVVGVLMGGWAQGSAYGSNLMFALSAIIVGTGSLALICSGVIYRGYALLDGSSAVEVVPGPDTAGNRNGDSSQSQSWHDTARV